MFKKVLIANRGEIAVRIIRACRELGVRTVAVFSEPDRESPHAMTADEAICIGPAKSADSYLNIKAILAACELTGAEAVHPGFGFLSENAGFARMCARCGVTFIGPSPEAMTLMGDKATAKQTMKKAGVPVVPGSDGLIESVEEAKALAEEIGYPVMVKASAGGGGRGIRRVDRPEDLEDAIVNAKQEAKSFFGDDGVYLEKFIVDPRHVEIQLLADQYGNTVYLGERDCPLQRRNQKMVEECPSPIMTPELRARMGEAAVRAAKACGYENAGTVEFLLSGDQFYFMEMNTRIQVEHPVTEFVTGVDLVKMQIRIAAGEELPFKQEDIHLTGHAIECRINAENPAQGFRPSPGRITALHMPGGPGIRIDTAVYSGYEITPYYDSMIAKLIAYAPTREEALKKMNWALAEFLVEGVDTNIDFQLKLLRDPDVEDGNYDIGFLGRNLGRLTK
mgnify:FL=1